MKGTMIFMQIAEKIANETYDVLTSEERYHLLRYLFDSAVEDDCWSDEVCNRLDYLQSQAQIELENELEPPVSCGYDIRTGYLGEN